VPILPTAGAELERCFRILLLPYQISAIVFSRHKMTAQTNGSAPQNYLPKNCGLFYDGASHDPKDGEYREIISAATGKVITKVAFAGKEDTVAALKAAEKAFESWRTVSTLERCTLLRRAAQVIRDHAEELAMLDAWNIGSPLAIMRPEVEYAAMNLDLFAGLIEQSVD
jgi:betaine-aldehyde dehydrogenase